MATVTYRLKPKVSVDLANQAWYNRTKEQEHDLTFKVIAGEEHNQGSTDLTQFCCHRLEALRDFLTAPKNKLFDQIEGLDELEAAIQSKQTRSPRKGGCIHCVIQRLHSDEFKFAEAA